MIMAKPTRTITGVTADKKDEEKQFHLDCGAEKVDEKKEAGGTFTLIVTWPEGTVLNK
jgi:hypothetical protein